MIAIFGTNHDDVLYFQSIMSNRTDSTVFKKYNVSIGTIFNQEVVLIDGNYTTILSGALSSYIFNHYHIDLAYVVGRCVSLTKGLKSGDIVIANRIINIDVDQINDNNVVLGQIPGFGQEYKVQNDLIGYLSDALNKRAYINPKVVTFLSCNDFSNANLEKIKENFELLNLDKAAIVDNSTGGVVISGQLYDVPVISIRVVEKELGKGWDVEKYLFVLDKYVALGKAVVSSIGDIGRNDVLFGGRGHDE